jgi:diguanylate cyclase (GGDEF)-like protein
LWSLVALMLGLVCSALVAHWQHGKLVEDRRSQLTRIAARSGETLTGELAFASQMIRALQATFLSANRVSAAEFATLHRILDKDHYVPALRLLEYAARRPTRDQPERFVTELVAPSAGNQTLVGVDVSSRPNDYEALQRSVVSDQPVLSVPFMHGDPVRGEWVAVSFRLPVFSRGAPPATLEERRSRLTGSVAAVFDVSALLKVGLPPDVLANFDIEVRDVDTDTLLFQSAPTGEDGKRGWLEVVEDVRFGERVWRVRMVAKPTRLPWSSAALLTLGIGLLASVMMALAVWSLIGMRQRAQHLANKLASQYQASETRFRALNDLLPVAVALVRADDGRLDYLNDAGRRRFGQHLTPSVSTLEQMIDDQAMVRQVLSVAESGQPLIEKTIHLGHSGGFWASLSVTRVELDGEARLLMVASDVSELRELTERLRFQATHDDLTGLGNRRAFDTELDRAIAAVDAGGMPRALLYLDLDQFKVVNDSSGHAAGDELLVRIADCLRDQLGTDDRLARLGGDEFGILLADGREANARQVADRLCEAVAGCIHRLDQRSLAVSASIGLVILDEPGMTRGDALSMADTACFLAKEHGRNRYYLYAESDTESAHRRSEMEWPGRIRHALSDGRMSLDFQEIRSLRKEVTGAGARIELLLRMRDPSGVMISPGNFIPAAERFGLMPLLDRWVVDTALANFDRLHPDGANLSSCSINLSGASVDTEGFADVIIAAIERHRVTPGKLCFEITETSAVGNLRRVQLFMRRLRAIGCRFALDDFGVGMASFGYLRQLPVDIIKIDGSFIRKIDTDPMSLAIVRAVAEIGHHADLRVVAESVDSPELPARLRLLGVDYVQGFALHYPEPAVYCRGSRDSAPTD